MDEERFKEILDAFLGDADLMEEINQSPTFEAGYELVAQKLPGLEFEEFSVAMDTLRQVMLANANTTGVN